MVIEQIEAIEYPILFIPFHGTPVPVQVRELTQAQLMSCGNFSLIETLEDKIRMDSKKCKISDIVAYAERNHNIVKQALINPTYDQLFKIVGTNNKVKEAKKELAELKKKIGSTKSGPQRSKLEEEIDNMRIWCDLILPNDFMSYVVSHALGINKSDIKTISQNMLLDAAVLAERGHDNPADHIDGRFTPFMKDDINKRAWFLLNQKRKENKPNAS
jgi:hypothetical protein